MLAWNGAVWSTVGAVCNSRHVSGFFFFASRRRHTRFKWEWSSDVCSSDLDPDAAPAPERGLVLALALRQDLPAAGGRPGTPLVSGQAIAPRPDLRHDGRGHLGVAGTRRQIGRASCRERV